MAPTKRAGSGGAATPPARRQRVEAAPGSSNPEPPPPSSPRKRFLAIALVVLFFKRPKSRSTDDNVPMSPSQIGRLVNELGQISHRLGTIARQLQSSIMKPTHAPSSEVNNITRPSASHHNNERLVRQHTKQQETSSLADGLAGTESEGKDGSIRLRFLSEMKPPVYHEDDIKSIRIGIFNGDTMIRSGPFSKLKIELSALEGSFPYHARGSWTPEEFHEHRAYGRDGKGNVLAGKGTNAQLVNGECHLDSIRFREGSCRARNGKFIIGARVCDGQGVGGRILEAVMNPVVVQDRRNKYNEKSHPPKLDDEVYRLEKIAVNGKYRDRLKEENIFTVEHFLKALYKDKDNLARILQIKKKCKDWDKMVEHAQECSLEGNPGLKSYRCEERNVVLFFNCVHRVLGAKFGGRYTASDMFNPAQQTLVDKLKKNAYDQWDDLTEDHVMKDNIPVPIDTDADAITGPSCMPSATQQKHSGHHFSVHQVGDTPAIGALIHAETVSSCQNANNDPSPGSSIPDDPHKAHNYQACNTQILQIQNVLSVGGPIVEGLSHGMSESPCAIDANDPCPSLSVPYHLRTQNYQDQGTGPVFQEQHSSDYLNHLRRLDSLGAQTFSWANDEIDMRLFLTHEANDSEFLLRQADYNNYVEMEATLLSPGNDTLEATASAHLNMASSHTSMAALAPQLTNTGASGSSTQGSVGQAPLPSSGTTGPLESPQQALPPQQWS